MKKYAVYIIRTADDFLYTGLTGNLEKRFHEHISGVKSFLKNKKQPFKLVYFEHFKTIYEAARREKEIKGWRREKKEKLIKYF